MTYWGLNAFFLAAVAIVGVVAIVVRRRRRQTLTGPDALSVVLVVAILLTMTAVFDNVMIGIGLVGYDSAKISGVFVGIAPLEDFSYAVAALVLLPSLWQLLPTQPSRQAQPTRPSLPSNENTREEDAR